MLKKIVMVAGLTAGLMANAAWAGNVGGCLLVVSAYNTNGVALTNYCNYDIEAAWCVGTNCSKLNNTWTIHPDQKLPIDSHLGDVVHYDGCKGANSIKKYTYSGTVECQ